MSPVRPFPAIVSIVYASAAGASRHAPGTARAVSRGTRSRWGAALRGDREAVFTRILRRNSGVTLHAAMLTCQLGFLSGLSSGAGRLLDGCGLFDDPRMSWQCWLRLHV